MVVIVNQVTTPSPNIKTVMAPNPLCLEALVQKILE